MENNNAEIERRALNKSMLELFKKMEAQLENIQSDLVLIKTNIAVFSEKMSKIEDWKCRHNIEHREDEKTRITRGQAVILMIMSSALGLISGIVAMIIKKGMF